MKTQSAKEPNKLKKGRLRAGKVKCRRCKNPWHRQKGEEFRICERCRTHCARCDCKLTEDNQCKSVVRYSRYYCMLCIAERKGHYKKDSQRDYKLLNNYGITVNEYEAILVDQGEVCWICQNPPKNKRLAVDHKHKSGERRRNPREKRSRVRGLLCWHCNAALGKFKDDSNIMRRAAEYVDTCPAQEILKGTK